MSANVRTLTLPGGGTLDIPLPGADSRFAIRSGSSALAGTPPRLAATIAISVTVGVALGVVATVWYLRQGRGKR